MDISLIIPAYNEEAYIGPTLESIIRNTRGKLKEIIVVDNGSKDGTAAVVRRYPQVKLVYERRKGTGNARQTGAEHATGDILAYVDADTVIPPGWVEYIENVFSKRPDVVFLSGAYRYRESTRYPLWLLNAIWWVTPPVYWIVGYMGNAGNCAMRADALKKINGHDRSISFYGDDTDLARRMHGVGKTLWRMGFYNYSSPRRFDKGGVVKECMQYMVNYWWPVLFHRPLTQGYKYIR